MRIKNRMAILAALLAALCLSFCCAEGAGGPLQEAAAALKSAATADEQLAVLYDVSLRCSAELETGGWEQSLTCLPAEGLPDDLACTEDALKAMEKGDLSMEDFADAKMVCLYNDQGTLRILGDFQVRIPEKNRASSLEEADTVVCLLHSYQGRSDYTGSAYDRYYTVYVFRRGENTCAIAGQKRTTPPLSGRGTLYGEKLSLAAIWESARPFFYGTVSVACPEGTATYRITGGSCCLAALEGSFVRYEVPESVEGYPVTGIERIYCETLEELVLPEGIVWIKDIVCYNLRSINFPSTLRRITGSITLDEVEHVVLNEGLEELSGRAFDTARGEDFRLPSALKTIGKGTLQRGVECAYLIIPDGVTVIPPSFLGESPRLVSIFIPAGVQKIEGSMNYGRSQIYAPEGSAAAAWAREKGYRWRACETAADMPIPYYGEENGFAYAVMGDEAMLMRYTGADEDVRIPDTLGGVPVTFIRSEAFFRNNYVRSVVIPETADKLPGDFYYGCPNLEAIYLPDIAMEAGFDTDMMKYFSPDRLRIYVPAGSARALEWEAFDHFRAYWGIWIPGMEQGPEKDFAWTGEQLDALHTVGATVTFGVKPPEEGEEGDPEPIEWTVLAAGEGRSLLITTRGLYQARFSDADNGPTSMSWTESSIRWKLQCGRFEAMFTYAERAVILPVENDGMADKIFLLSKDEAETYFAADEDRICTAAKNGEEQAVSWWLRTRGTSENNYLMTVWKTGEIGTGGEKYLHTFYVRPAMWVKTD